MPFGNLLIDSHGSLYGEALGSPPDFPIAQPYPGGMVFSVSPSQSGFTARGVFDGTNGYLPEGGVVMDAHGNLYGTTVEGGVYNDGVVFEIPAGSSTIIDLASFSGANGAWPSSGVTIDSAGNLFGTTQLGGTNNDGVVFELASGSGTITPLASFNVSNGQSPDTRLVMDRAGNLYGTTRLGGAGYGGVVFELAANSSSITDLAAFHGVDGANPDALTLDSAGNLFGTTSNGGPSNDGVVFELAKGSSSTTTLVNFNYFNGANPIGGLALSPGGTLYGVTSTGGDNENGTVYSLTVIGDPVKLAFDQQPTDTTVANDPAGSYSTSKIPTVTVDVEDANGNIVSSDDSVVTLTITPGTGPIGATLGGTYCERAVNGVATFSDLTLPAGSYTLTAKDGTLDPAVSQSFTATTLFTLANLAADSYNTLPTVYNGYTPLQDDGLSRDPKNLGYAADAYETPDHTQIVLAFRGTVLDKSTLTNFFTTLKNLAADLSFGGSVPSPMLYAEMADAVRFLKLVEHDHPMAHITLTGHSLGGAVAQLLGEYSGLPTYTFNAPGGAQLYYPLLLGLSNPPQGGTNTNYRIFGDQVSLFGTPIGTTVTLVPPTGTTFNPSIDPAGDLMVNGSTYLTLHKIPAVLTQILSSAATSTSQGPNDAAAIQLMFVPSLSQVVNGKLSRLEIVYAGLFAISNIAGFLIDPSSGTQYSLTGAPGSPLISSLTLPSLSGVASYNVSYDSNGVWSADQSILPGAPYVFPTNASGVAFAATDSSGQAIELPDSFLFAATFASTGTFNATLAVDGGTPSDHLSVTAPGTQNAVSGQNQSFSLGSFTSDTVGPYNVYVSWGDGSPDSVFSVNDAGPIPAASHTYANSGQDTVTVTVVDPANDVSNSTSFVVNVGTTVSIPDGNLLSAICSALGLPGGSTVTVSEMEQLTSLTAENSGIQDLTGLHYATNLQYLDLNGNQITDISPLAGLVNLQHLFLRGNQISDISGLSGLTNLTQLAIGHNAISSVSSLSGLANLTTLGMTNCQVTDLGPLAGLAQLSTLSFDYNRVSDVNPLAGLTNLQNLSLGENQVSDLSPLGNLSRLVTLNIVYNSIDISPDSPALGVIAALQSGRTSVAYTPQHASQLVVTTRPSSPVEAGSSFAVVITAEDGQGNTDADFNGEVTFSLTTNSNGAVSTQTVTVQAVDGVATFNNLTAEVAGAYSLALSDRADGLVGDDTDSLTITPAAASRLVFSTQPVGTTVGTVLSPTVVSIEDPYGNVETGDTSVVSIAINSGPVGGAFTPTSTVTVNAVNGVATFGNLAVDTPGTYTLAVADSTDSLSNSGSDDVNITSATSSTALTSTTNPSVYGQSVTFTATVTPTAAWGVTPTGTVTFYDGSTMLAAVALAGSDTASYSTGTFAVGSHPVTAVYSGDANEDGSTSAVLDQVVDPYSTHVALTVSNTTPVVGQRVTLRATVSVLPPGTGPVTGSVAFSEGGVSLGTASLANGVATLVAPLPTAGVSSVTAVYSPGSPAFAPSTSPGVSVSVGPDTTTTTLTTTPATVVVGQAKVLRATVAVLAPGTGTPTGSVTFYDGTTALGTVTLTNKSASLSQTFTSPGGHSFTAVYSGDSNDGGSTSTASLVTVNPDSTRTALSVTPATVVVGQSVVLKATLAVLAPGVGTPTGTVSFYNGSTLIGIQPLSVSAPYTASITTSTLPLGSAQPVTAVYSGDGNDNGSTSTAAKITVNPMTTRTVATDTPTPAVVGRPVSLTATVSVAAPGVGTPTGSVTFMEGSTVLGTVAISGNTATLPWTFSTAGLQPITAAYSGDTNNKSSTGVVNVNVGKDVTKTTLASSATPAVPGQSVTFTASVAVQSPGAGTPTGTVTFKDGATVLGTGTLSGGVATFTTTTLAPGTHSITALYAGDTNDGASNSVALSEKIQWDTTVSLTSSTPSGDRATSCL
jgi:uncharacterized repeat protein (TIGR03803 family)